MISVGRSVRCMFMDKSLPRLIAIRSKGLMIIISRMLYVDSTADSDSLEFDDKFIINFVKQSVVSYPSVVTVAAGRKNLR